MADPIFAEPRLAQIYDALDADRSDLDAYAAMVTEFRAHSVLDIGCGTGTFACMLAGLGIDVTAVDPAAASLEVAQSKTNAGRVQWVHGDATSLPPLSVDAAFMTGNVAQVFTTDEDWEATLRAVHAALRPGGRFVFEARDPSRRAWEKWTAEHSQDAKDIPGIGRVDSWTDLIAVHGELVTFRWTITFSHDGTTMESDSTLRFRSRDAIAASLRSTGFVLDEVRDAPDRPGLEFVFVTTRVP